MRSRGRGATGRDGSPGAPGAPGTPGHDGHDGHDGAQAPMDPAARQALERLLQSLGENIDVLHGLERIAQALEVRYRHHSRKMLKVAGILAAFTVLALALTSVQLHQARSSARENRALIARLTVLADRAQLQGIRVNLSQCREIEKLKVPIRRVLRESGAENSRFLILFRARPCRALKPVKP